MKTVGIFQLATAAMIASLAPAALEGQRGGKLDIVATTPDLASIATAIGGQRVAVKALAKPTEDPHYVDARPSLIVTLNRADVLIDGGAELEIGWLPALLQSARNSKLAPGAPGRVSASLGVSMLEVPTTLDRSRGDVHALGNPHFLLDPVNVKLIATQISDHFTLVDPGSAEVYRTNLAAFQATLDTKFDDWKRQLAPYGGAKIVTYHRDFVYLAARFNFDIIDTLEPKPGIAPSPSHLAQVIGKMKAANAHVILVQPYQNRRTAETVARQTNATVLDISQQPGAIEHTDTYFDLMDYIVRTLTAAFQEKP